MEYKLKTKDSVPDWDNKSGILYVKVKEVKESWYIFPFQASCTFKSKKLQLYE